MNLIEAAILGLVEGITEYLPISSTGHLILASALLGLDEPGDVKRSVDAFSIVIQGGAILAVLGLYWPRVLQMIRGMIGRDTIGLRLACNLLIAFLPAAVIGVLLADRIESQLFYSAPVIIALAVGGLIMILLTPWQRSFFHDDENSEPNEIRQYVDIEHLTWRRALLIGLLQCIAMWPGTSRSMMTIVGGMLIGLRPKQAAEFSFLLGLPTLAGACVYRLSKNLMGDGPNMFEVLDITPVIVGFVVATLSAAIAVKWLVSYLSHHGVAAFGWYRLGLCSVLTILVSQGVVDISPDEEPTDSTHQAEEDRAYNARNSTHES